MSSTNGHNSNGNGHNGNGHKPPKQSRQAKQPVKKTAVAKANPQQIVINRLKGKFLECLKKNAGNVSNALRMSKLTRSAAYDHFKADKQFADDWLDALEVSNDELFSEARRRAKDGVLEPIFHNGKKVADVKKYSDTLIIFLLKQSEYQKKWRNRLIKAGNLAVETVRDEGKRAGLSENQIVQIQNKIVEQLNDVSLV